MMNCDTHLCVTKGMMWLWISHLTRHWRLKCARKCSINESKPQGSFHIKCWVMHSGSQPNDYNWILHVRLISKPCHHILNYACHFVHFSCLKESKGNADSHQVKAKIMRFNSRTLQGHMDNNKDYCSPFRCCQCVRHVFCRWQPRHINAIKC